MPETLAEALDDVQSHTRGLGVGAPVLACEAFLRDFEGQEIELKPLRRFPVIHDLIVDRSRIYEILKQNNVFIGKYSLSENGDHEQEYTAAKCLKCGLCIEVCPNYTDGRRFYGAAFANDCYIVASRNPEKNGEIGQLYNEHFKGECSYDLGCMAVCPMGIKMTASMKMLNSIKNEKNGDKGR